MSERPQVFVDRSSDISAFIKGVTEDRLEHCFGSVSGIDGESREEPSEYEFYVREFLKLRRLKSPRYTPRWFNLEGFCGEVSWLNSATTWELLLNSAPGEHSRGVESYLFTADIPDSAKRISLNNKRFMFHTIAISLLGTVLACRTKEIVKPRATLLLRRNQGYSVALAVGGMFDKPASTPNEVLERFQLLIPPSGNSPEVFFNLLTKNRVFERERMGGSEINRCPAIYLTRMMLQAYGNLLNESSYQERFIQAIVR